MAIAPFILSLSGSLTVSRSEAIHASLLDALANHAAVEIDCSEAEDIDVSFLQILMSAAKTALVRNKSISLSSPPVGLLSEAISRCGFPVPEPGVTSLAGLFCCESTPQ